MIHKSIVVSVQRMIKFDYFSCLPTMKSPGEGKQHYGNIHFSNCEYICEEEMDWLPWIKMVSLYRLSEQGLIRNYLKQYNLFL